MTRRPPSLADASRSLLIAMLALAAGLAGPLCAQEPAQEIAVETKLVAGEGADNDNFGSALAIDGDMMVVAAPQADVGGVETSGAVYIFLRDPTSGQWVEEQHLLPADGNFGDNYSDLTLAVQGDTIVVGAPKTTIDRSREGAVYVFERGQGGPGLWGEVATLADASVGVNGNFGSSVALEGDLLVVGAAPEYFGTGLVRIFERDRGGADNWGEVTTLAHTAVGDADHPRSFGSAVAIEGDLLVVGASRTSVSWIGESDGAAYLFRRDATDPDRWEYVARLIVPGADQCVGGLTVSQFVAQASVEAQAAAAACAEEIAGVSGAFGHRVALDGDTIVVSAPLASGEDGTRYVGRAYVYRRDSSNDALWQYVVSLSGSGTSLYNYFGNALALAGDTVLIGAPGTTIEARAFRGAAYLFERGAGGPDAWGEVEKLVAYDGLSYGNFGSAVALDGAARIIGALGDSAFRGAVYILEASDEPDIPEEPEQPAFPATAELVNDTVAVDESGVVLGAVQNAILNPLQVWIHEVAPPPEPLFPGATPIGRYYNIGAVETTRMPTETPFAVALPVPPTANPSHLALAALVPADLVLGGTSTGMAWTQVIGTHDPENDLYVVTFAGLYLEGQTIVLIEHPDVATEPVNITAGARTLVSTSANFEVECHVPNCEATLQRTLDALEHAHAVYSKSFTQPFLARKRYTYCSTPLPLFCGLGPETGIFRGIHLYKEIIGMHGPLCDYAPAYTSTFSQSISICLDVSNHPTEYFDATVAHELFHAYQFELPHVWDTPLAQWSTGS